MYSLDDSTFDVHSVEYELYRGAAGHSGAVLAPYPICKVSCCGVTCDGSSVRAPAASSNAVFVAFDAGANSRLV
jgi:hypothetical protein